MLYSVAYRNMLKRLHVHHAESTDLDGYKKQDHSEISDGATQSSEEYKESEHEKLSNGIEQEDTKSSLWNGKRCIHMESKILQRQKKKAACVSAHDSNRISYNDAKTALEFLIILAEIRHEMNQAGNGKQRIQLYGENSSNGREAIWKRICRFLRTKVDEQNRFALRKLIQYFKNIDTEFRNTYDYYVQPNEIKLQSLVDRPKNVENDPVAIQQKVILKVQLMQKYLENRASGDKETPNINLVQHLDEVINEFSKLTE